MGGEVFGIRKDMGREAWIYFTQLRDYIFNRIDFNPRLHSLDTESDIKAYWQ